jgi:glycosyltransferase involved in cell wall biosynthesis
MSTFKITAKKADALIVSTNQEFSECIEFGVDKDRMHVIPAGIDVGEYNRIVVGRNADRKRVLFVGRISRDRNIEQILTAFKSLLEKMQNIELYIVGGEVKRSYADKGGYLAELKMLAEKLGINKNVKFLGPLCGKNLINAYKSADVFVYTSFYENLGHTILEAAASALPIISTPVGIANDIVKNDETGYLVGYGSQELSDKLLSLLKDDRKREKFGKNIYDLIKREYNWEAIIDRYVSLYEMLLK